MVHSLATTGKVDNSALESSLYSLFQLETNSINDIYPSAESISLGLQQIRKAFGQGETEKNFEVIQYSLGLMQLNYILQKQKDTLHILGKRMEDCEKQSQFFNSYSDENMIGKLADIYMDTLSTFTFRIQVKGNPQHLQNPHLSAKVRAILLAGVRASMLWGQLGGRRWLIPFKRRKIHDIANKLLADNTL